MFLGLILQSTMQNIQSKFFSLAMLIRSSRSSFLLSFNLIVKSIYWEANIVLQTWVSKTNHIIQKVLANLSKIMRLFLPIFLFPTQMLAKSMNLMPISNCQVTFRIRVSKYLPNYHTPQMFLCINPNYVITPFPIVQQAVLWYE